MIKVQQKKAHYYSAAFFVILFLLENLYVISIHRAYSSEPFSFSGAYLVYAYTAMPLISALFSFFAYRNQVLQKVSISVFLLHIFIILYFGFIYNQG
jgi:tryptophan-rich sensory protein